MPDTTKDEMLAIVRVVLHAHLVCLDKQGPGAREGKGGSWPDTTTPGRMADDVRTGEMAALLHCEAVAARAMESAETCSW